jgi:hypothetical protein
VAETRRALIWGAALPVAALVGALVLSPWMLLVLLVYPLQMMRLARRGPLPWAFFTVLGKVPEAVGAVQYYARSRRGPARIIEYK